MVLVKQWQLFRLCPMQLLLHRAPVVVAKRLLPPWSLAEDVELGFSLVGQGVVVVHERQAVAVAALELAPVVVVRTQAPLVVRLQALLVAVQAVEAMQSSAET